MTVQMLLLAPNDHYVITCKSFQIVMMSVRNHDFQFGLGDL